MSEMQKENLTGLCEEADGDASKASPTVCRNGTLVTVTTNRTPSRPKEFSVILETAPSKEAAMKLKMMYCDTCKRKTPHFRKNRVFECIRSNIVKHGARRKP